jgi:tetratricopeptide (TPR) repeat protein
MKRLCQLVTAMIVLILASGCFSPQSAETLMELARNSLKIAKPGPAIEYFSQVIKANPGLATAYIGRAEAFFIKGKTDESIDDCKKVLELKPGDMDALLLRGMCHEARNENVEAMKIYEDLMKKYPKNGEPLVYRGNMYIKQNELEKAMKTFDRAIKLDAKCGEAYWSRALEDQRDGKYEESLKDYTFIIEKKLDCGFLAPESYHYFNRGSIYRQLNNKIAAQKDWEMVGKLSPDSPESRMANKWLDSIGVKVAKGTDEKGHGGR